MANALLDKFSKVKVKENSLIPVQDKPALDKLHSQYETAMEQMDEWHQFYVRENENNPLPSHKIKLDNYCNPPKLTVHKTDPDKEDPFSLYRYSVCYNIIKLADDMQKCREYYVTKVYDYFEGKHGIYLNKQKEVLAKLPKLTYINVVEDILKSNGYLTFNAIAKKQTIGRFRENIKRGANVKLANKNIELSNYMIKAKFEQYDSKIIQLEKAIMLYETGNPAKGEMFTEQEHFNKYIDNTIDYTFPACQKLEALRFFQNGKVKLTFKTAAMATEFHEYFDLQTL